MKNLFDKYKEETLTPKDLQTLQEQTMEMGNDELEQMFLDDWVSSDKEPAMEKDLIDFEQMKQSIDEKLRTENKPIKVFSLQHLFRYAAALLIPVLLVSTFYFYRKSEVVTGQEMIIKTAEGERVSITLPDGTSVKINSKSELRYNSADFNKSARTVCFNGEGYFDVTTNPDASFIIESQHLKLKVLGTSFNFLSREQLGDIEVTLIKGHVLLSASDKKQELFENEKAIFNKNTGEFKILKDKENVIHWMRNELHFKNTPFSMLLNSIEQEYNIQFKLINCEKLTDDMFSGTLPSTNLEAVMEILKKSYGINYTIASNVVTIEAKF